MVVNPTFNEVIQIKSLIMGQVLLPSKSILYKSPVPIVARGTRSAVL